MNAKNLFRTTLGAWSILGGYRNIQYNRYKDNQRKEQYIGELNIYKTMADNQIIHYKSSIERLEKNIKQYNKPRLIVDESVDFIIGSFIYINPIFSFFTIPTELYRLEVNIRGLEEEKQSDRYYKVYPF